MSGYVTPNGKHFTKQLCIHRDQDASTAPPPSKKRKRVYYSTEEEEVIAAYFDVTKRVKVPKLKENAVNS